MRALLVLAIVLLPAASAQWTDGASNPYDASPIRVHLDVSNLTAETMRYLDEARAGLAYWEAGGGGSLRWDARFEEVATPEEGMVHVWFVDAPYVLCGGDAAAGCGGFREGEDGSLTGMAAIALRAGGPGIGQGSGPSPDARYLPYETVRQTVTHEVGHALGLRHSDDYNDVMYRHVTANGFADAPGDTWLQRNPVALLGVVTLLGLSPFALWKGWHVGSRRVSEWRERRAMGMAKRKG